MTEGRKRVSVTTHGCDKCVIESKRHGSGLLRYYLAEMKVVSKPEVEYSKAHLHFMWNIIGDTVLLLQQSFSIALSLSSASRNSIELRVSSFRSNKTYVISCRITSLERGVYNCNSSIEKESGAAMTASKTSENKHCPLLHSHQSSLGAPMVVQGGILSTLTL